MSAAAGHPHAEYDAVVIGAGVNGLTCAALLAHAGRRVLVLEAQAQTGGLLRSTDLIAGLRAPQFAHCAGPIDPAITKALKLSRFGLAPVPVRLGAIALSHDGRHIYLDSHSRKTAASIAQHSQNDAKAWPLFETSMRRVAAQFSGYLTDVPVARPAARGAFLGVGGRSKPPDESVRGAAQGFLNRAIADLMEEVAETPLLQGAVAFEAVTGAGAGPRSAGTVMRWLERLAAETGRQDTHVHIPGGPGALTDALAQAATAAGATIRTGAEALRAIIREGRVAGVALAAGDAVFATAIISSMDPFHTFKTLGCAQALPFGFKRRLIPPRPAPGVAKVNLALRGLPAFRGLEPRDLKSRLLIGCTLDAVERSFAAAMDGDAPEFPSMEVVLPSAIDPAAASGDQHVLSALIAFAPVTEDAGALRDQLAKNVIAALSLYAPDLPSRVLMAQAQDPQSIAGASGRASTDWRGAPFGPMDPDNPYASPAPGLYFCGAGMHPRSGANGLAGRNCAEALLAGALRGAEGGS